MIDKEENEWTLFVLAWAALIFAAYPMVKDLVDTQGKTIIVMLLTLFFSFVLMIGAQCAYQKYFKHRQ